ncbi:Protein CBG18441 [Caenorhabditis briggsae]|uniref:Protein CBG18441 n=1 Tax=Caenorhabditis briggsae TaxID=6238 RepID=A8XTB6_CAEBR|nr:Protein CBG18441 [Caenorhabditis briggsae]CAP35893.2 Protein CBG18441 [Caenorhabditis briggsae]
MEKEGFARLFHNFENVIEPKMCSTSGTVPSYLKGTMVRNGPGMFEIGENKYNHWFDGLGFIQRYHFKDGKMYYSARYLESEAYKKNMEAQRIVAGSFGTGTFSDPCKTIFSRFFSNFVPNDEKHDNANVAFTPVGDGVYACTETPHMLRIDLDTLKTLEPIDMSKYVALHTCTAHQLYDENGDVYNIGSRFGPDSAHQSLLGAHGENWRDKVYGSNDPTYMHSFGMSENYLIMFESPIRLDIKKFLMRNFISATYRDCLKWHSDKEVKVFIMDKKTGKNLDVKFEMDPFFTFHHANTFEKDGCLVVDYCRMGQTGNFDALLIENMKTGNFQNDPNFLPYLTRLIIPLSIPDNAKTEENLLESLDWASGCSAILQANEVIRLKEKRTCNVSMEFPRYHWEKINMKEYKYVYGCLIVPIMTLSEGQNPFVLILDAKNLLEIARFTIPEARIPLGFHGFYKGRPEI